MHYLFLAITSMMMGGLVTASVTLSDGSEDAESLEQAKNEEFTLRLQEAGAEIEDPEIRAYYFRLIDEIGPQEFQPDIESIYYESLTTPFQQAGLQIEDPQIKQMYYRFIGDLELDQ